MRYEIDFLENEHWWGGSTLYGTEMPIGINSTYSHDFRNEAHNQTMPLFLSDKGRYIWSEDPFLAEVKNGKFICEGTEIEVNEAGNSLKEAYIAAMKAHFPFQSKELPKEFRECPSREELRAKERKKPIKCLSASNFLNP